MGMLSREYILMVAEGAMGKALSIPSSSSVPLCPQALREHLSGRGRGDHCGMSGATRTCL